MAPISKFYILLVQENVEKCRVFPKLDIRPTKAIVLSSILIMDNASFHRKYGLTCNYEKVPAHINFSRIRRNIPLFNAHGAL